MISFLLLFLFFCFSFLNLISFLFFFCFSSYFCFIFFNFFHFCFYHFSLIIHYLFSFSFSFSLFITQFYFIIHHSPDKLDCVFSYRFNLHKEICVEICLISSLFFFACYLFVSYFHLFLLLQYPF